MQNQYLRKLAKILVRYSVDVQPGDWVHIISNVVAVPLIAEVFEQVLLAGGYPTLQMDIDQCNEKEQIHKC